MGRNRSIIKMTRKGSDRMLATNEEMQRGSLTVIKSKNIGKPLKYGFLFVKFLFLYVVCVVIMI